MRMYRSVSCLIGVVAFVVPIIKSQNVKSNIREYFESEIVSRFQTIWKKQKKSFENAIVMEMQDIYGRKGMNVYIRRTNEALQLAKGYYHTDNQVQLILADMKLDNIPVLWFPFVNLNLADNMIKFKSSLSKMIVISNYVVFRNKSDIIYELKEQDPYRSSPFRFEQVKNSGELAITIEGCVITANIISTMNVQSVNLGHGSFKLNNCRYTLEISSPGMGVSPVITKYNFKGDGLNIEDLLMKPLKNEFLPKLQAALFSVINSSDIFRDDMSRIRHKQENIFHITKKDINDAVRKMNKLTVDRNLNIAELEDFETRWNDGLNDKKQDRYIRLTRMVMSGLDTAYTAHIGGPYKIGSVGFMEEIRFSSIQVRGDFIYEGLTKATDIFAVDIIDVAVNFNANLTKNYDYEFEVTGWRQFEVVAPSLAFSSSEALITGYLLKAVPKQIMKHLSRLFKETMEASDKYIENKDPVSNAEQDQELSDNIPEITKDEAPKDQSSGNLEFGSVNDKTDTEGDVGKSEKPNKQLGDQYFKDPLLVNNTINLSDAQEETSANETEEDTSIEQKTVNKGDLANGANDTFGDKYFKESFLGNISGAVKESSDSQDTLLKGDQQNDNELSEEHAGNGENFFRQSLLAKKKPPPKDSSSVSSSDSSSSGSSSDSDKSQEKGKGKGKGIGTWKKKGKGKGKGKGKREGKRERKGKMRGLEEEIKHSLKI